MAIKSYSSGTRFNELMYGILIAKTFDEDPSQNCFSIGFETVDPRTGRKIKMQTPSIGLGDFEIVSDFNTDIQPID